MKDAYRNFLLHRITIGWVLLFTINSLATSIMAALTGAQWSDLDEQSKFMICVAVMANWTGVLAAFFNQAASRLRDGRDILPGGTTPPHSNLNQP